MISYQPTSILAEKNILNRGKTNAKSAGQNWSIKFYASDRNNAETLSIVKRLSIVIGQSKSDTSHGFVTGRAVDIDDNGYLLVV
jgi:hypothetical protein